MVFIVQFDIKSENYDVMKDGLCTHFTSLHINDKSKVFITHHPPCYDELIEQCILLQNTCELNLVHEKSKEKHILHKGSWKFGICAVAY